MRIIAIDQALNCTGIVVADFSGKPRLDHAGVIRPPQAWTRDRKARHLRDGILAITAEHGQLDLLAHESVHVGKFVQPAITGGIAIGVVYAACPNLPVAEIRPMEWRMACGISNRPGGAKRRAAVFAAAAYGRPSLAQERDDVTDAACIAFAAWSMARTREMLARAGM